jgi:prepilin-type N-terminal cleavage/methylation domain-containing protein
MRTDNIRTRTEESGVSLVELLVAITITGIVAVGMVTGLTTLSVSSDRARKGADASSVLYTAADVVQKLPFSTTCPATYALGTPAGIPAAGATMRVNLTDVNIAKVEYWDQANSKFEPDPVLYCVPALALGDTRRLQRITLHVQLADGRVNRDLQVVKRG